VQSSLAAWSAAAGTINAARNKLLCMGTHGNPAAAAIVTAANSCLRFLL
jgi:hypothetical protein